MKARALVTSLLAVVLGVASYGCGRGDCGTVLSSAPREASGVLTYRPGDGSITYGATEATIWEAAPTALTLNARLATATASASANAASDARLLTLELHQLEVGRVRSFTGDAQEQAFACISMPYDDASGRTPTKTCLPFVGTADVKTLDRDCYRHESGIGTCAMNIDVTIRGTATSGTTTLDIALTVISAQHWSNTTKCGSD